MNILDQIFHKRLKRIRKDLDSYIELGLLIEKARSSAPVAGGASEEKKKGGVQEKFLRYMKLNDEDDEDYYDDDYLDEEDECSELPPPEAKSRSVLESPSHASEAMRSSSTVKPIDTGRLPEFLKREAKPLDLDAVLAKKEESFSEMLLRMIDERGLKDSDVYKRANIDRRLFSKIRGDVDYLPSKKTAISFCLALQLEMDEAKKLLATAGYTLSESSRFDLIIMYLIETCEYNVHFANIVLDDYGEGTLSR